jgi:hypothetical protein
MRVAVLVPPPYEVELFYLPTRAELSSLALSAAQWESEEPRGRTAALAWRACLTLVNEELAEALSAWSLPRLAQIAEQKAESHRAAATKMVVATVSSAARRDKTISELLTTLDGWMLLAIPEADELLLAAATRTGVKESGNDPRYQLFAALLAHERTRARAIERAAALSFAEQSTVLTFLSYWENYLVTRSAIPVDLGDATEFARGHRFLRGFYEHMRALARLPIDEQEEMLLRLVREHVGPTWEQGFRDQMRE